MAETWATRKLLDGWTKHKRNQASSAQNNLGKHKANRDDAHGWEEHSSPTILGQRSSLRNNGRSQVRIGPMDGPAELVARDSLGNIARGTHRMKRHQLGGGAVRPQWEHRERNCENNVEIGAESTEPLKSAGKEDKHRRFRIGVANDTGGCINKECEHERTCTPCLRRSNPKKRRKFQNASNPSANKRKMKITR